MSMPDVSINLVVMLVDLFFQAPGLLSAFLLIMIVLVREWCLDRRLVMKASRQRSHHLMAHTRT